MNISKHTAVYIHLHFIVLLLGFTAILGALISIGSIPLVWFRMLLALAGLGVYMWLRGISFGVSAKGLFLLFGIGVVVAAHWVTFFHAIKVSNVSVTLGVFASTTLFTGFIEPLSQKRKISGLEIFTGLFIVGGIYLIFQYEFHYLEGILYALLSALLNGLFVVFNRNISTRWHPSTISFYEMLGGFLALTLLMGMTSQIHSGLLILRLADWLWIGILALVCTSYAFSAVVEIMKVLSAYTVVLSINLEPVYGIMLAFFIFGEANEMSMGFFVGTLIILLSVFFYPFFKHRYHPNPS